MQTLHSLLAALITLIAATILGVGMLLLSVLPFVAAVIAIALALRYFGFL